MTSDAELAGRAQSWDEASLERVVARHGERARRYIATIVGDPSATEDLRQETFQRAHEHLGELAGPSRLSSWILAIAVNLCRAHLQGMLRHGRAASLQEGDEPQRLVRRSVLSSVMRRESAELLALAIDRLPVLLWEAFVLHYVEGPPYDEMADIAQARVGTLHVRAHRARGLLRQQLGAAVDTFWSRE